MNWRFFISAISALFLMSCDFELDCRTCFSMNQGLVMSADGERCVCDENYWTLGEFGSPSCDREDKLSIGAAGKCVMTRENTWFMTAGDDCYCSAYTQHDTVIVEFATAGSMVQVFDAYDVGTRESTGRHVQSTVDP